MSVGQVFVSYTLFLYAVSLSTRAGVDTGRTTIGVTSQVLSDAACRFGGAGAKRICGSMGGLPLSVSIGITYGCGG